MFGFLSRIPELLGLKRSAASKPAATKATAPAKGGEAQSKQTPRGRGAGRGTTPRTVKSAGGNRSRKKK